jgi:1-acyl-sn-glycerol-3-phosphate acyltransferase
VIDKKKSNGIFVKQITDMLHAKRLDKEDVRQGLTIINEVAKEVEEGRRYILFPEGGYAPNQRNTLGEFKAGCFKISLKSKTPIVPVVLVDSYKVFNGFYPMGIMAKSQVHYLSPIMYEEYKDMRTREIADMVKKRIQDKLEELAES